MAPDETPRYPRKVRELAARSSDGAEPPDPLERAYIVRQAALEAYPVILARMLEEYAGEDTEYALTKQFSDVGKLAARLAIRCGRDYAEELYKSDTEGVPDAT